MKPAITSSKIVHQNPWYKIRRDELIWPNGKHGEYFVVEYPPSVIVIAIERERILVIEQYRHTVGHTSIEFVAGHGEPDEEPTATAKRELEEEGGYMADQIERLGAFDGLNGSSNLVFNVFLATGLQKTKQRLEDSEFGLEFKWISLREWRDMIHTGKVQDGPTLAAWAMYSERMPS